MLTHVQLRNLFIEFWKQRNHRESPAIPLVPQNDPTTLFTGSGMQPLVPYLLGEPHPQGNRLYNIQPCFRSQDIDEVGDNRHTTFFEMMGNWSLGDYFKEEQLTWFWEFLTEVVKLPKEKLYVSVFAGTKDLSPDEESLQIWKKLGVSEEKIFKYGPEKNWWSRAGVPENMPAGEPGGPDSEVFYEFIDIPHNLQYGKTCHPNCDCGRFMEIGNSVFMQYKKNSDGTFSDLPAMNVDFGGGLERILAASNNDPDIFKIDIFSNLLDFIKDKFTDEINEIRLKRIRIFLDHSRAIMFLIMNGVLPGKNDRESVMRRLIRRADDQINILFQGDRIICSSIWEKTVIHFRQIYKDTFALNDNSLIIINNELNKYQNVFKYVKEEKNKFIKLIENHPQISIASGLAGPIAFEYQSSKGISFETSKSLAEELKLDLNIWEEKYRESMNKHKEISKAGVTKKFKGGLSDHSVQTIKYHTATHLLHQSLFDVLGQDVRQEGSNITVERLRFDFYSTTKLADEQIKKVEKIINEKIQEKLPVEFKIVPKKEAIKLNAKSFFREKYPGMVKIYFVGNYSKEFCGGPHVKNTAEIDKIEIYKFEKIGSNLYRIYAK